MLHLLDCQMELFIIILSPMQMEALRALFKHVLPLLHLQLWLDRIVTTLPYCAIPIHFLSQCPMQVSVCRKLPPPIHVGELAAKGNQNGLSLLQDVAVRLNLISILLMGMMIMYGRYGILHQIRTDVQPREILLHATGVVVLVLQE